MKIEKKFGPVPPMESYELLKVQSEARAPIQEEFFEKIRALIEGGKE
ncbi:hypothetical protein [Weissella confusa]